MSNDKLNVEVTELLEKTDSLLNSPVGGPSLSDTARSNGSLRRLNLPPTRQSRSITRASSLRSGTVDGAGADEYSDAGSRLRESFDAATRKFLAFKKTASFKEPLSVDIPRKATSSEREVPTPRLKDALTSRSTPSIALTDPSTTLERSASMTLISNQRDTSAGGTGRTYNSFAGLQDMVSMVDELVAASAAGSVLNAPQETRFGSPGRLGVGTTQGSVAGVGSRGSSLVAGLDSSRPAAAGLRSSSPSRLGSPSRLPSSPLRSSSPLRPSSPLRKASGPSGVAVPPLAATSPRGAQGSRRAQLQALLSKDVAQPEAVIKFKAELAGQARSPVNMAALTGDFQEKLDQVERKLKNWDLVETVATERFTTGMDAALDAIFSRVNLTWPSGGVAFPGAPASTSGRPSSKGLSREGERRHNKAEGAPERHFRGSGGCPGEAEDAGCGWGSPASSGSKVLGWDEVSSSTTGPADHQHPSSDSEASAGGRGGDAHSRGSKHHSQRRDSGSGQGMYGSRRREGSGAGVSSRGRSMSSKQGAARMVPPDVPQYDRTSGSQGCGRSVDADGQVRSTAIPATVPMQPNGACSPAARPAPIPAYPNYYVPQHANYGGIGRPGSSAPSVAGQTMQQGGASYPMAHIAPQGAGLQPQYPFMAVLGADNAMPPAPGMPGNGLEQAWMQGEAVNTMPVAMEGRAAYGMPPAAWTYSGQPSLPPVPPYGVPSFGGSDSGAAVYQQGLPQGIPYASLSAPGSVVMPLGPNALANTSSPHMFWKPLSSQVGPLGGGNMSGSQVAGTYGYAMSPNSPTMHRYGGNMAGKIPV